MFVSVEDLIGPMWERTTHYCANHRVTFDGADRAKGICDVYCIGNLADGQAAHVVASYHDDYERRGGKWATVRRFVNQRVFSHLTWQARKSVVEGKSVAVRVDLGGCRTIKQKKTKKK